MGWFHLDPASVAARVTASGAPARLPSLGSSVLRGVLGFTLVSVAGFAPWALAGRALHRAVGEAGMYVACAGVFIGLSGLPLHRLIVGPGSLPRFYALFSVSFAVYSATWIAAWMGLHGHTGSLVGLFAGTALMGGMLARAFGDPGAAPAAIAALFVLNAAGYFAGGWVEARVAAHGSRTLAMLLWGVCFGIGMGAGLGIAFHRCQRAVRALLLRASASSPG